MEAEVDESSEVDGRAEVGEADPVAGDAADRIARPLRPGHQHGKRVQAVDEEPPQTVVDANSQGLAVKVPTPPPPQPGRPKSASSVVLATAGEGSPRSDDSASKDSSRFRR